MANQAGFSGVFVAHSLILSVTAQDTNNNDTAALRKLTPTKRPKNRFGGAVHCSGMMIPRMRAQTAAAATLENGKRAGGFHAPALQNINKLWRYPIR
ncbi:MAG: hypothetical protein ACJARC_000477 [Sulfitobacter sp.]